MESDDCVVCGKTVRPRQEAIACDTCQLWQHRICQTNVSRQDYRRMVKGLLELEFNCYRCSDTPDDDDVDTATDATVDTPDDDVDTATDATVDTPDAATDVTFNIDASFARRAPTQERSIALETTVHADFEQDDPITYREVPAATQRGKPILVDNRGYSYTLWRTAGDKLTWRCTKRSKTLTCPATVIQNSTSYKEGRKEHAHDPEPGAFNKITITSEVNAMATTD